MTKQEVKQRYKEILKEWKKTAIPNVRPMRTSVPMR